MFVDGDVEVLARLAVAAGLDFDEPGGNMSSDRVAVMLPNTRAYVVALFGGLRAGATVVQVNPIYVGRELEHMLTITDAATIVVGAGALDTVRGVRPATSLARVLVVGDALTEDGEESFDEVVAAGNPDTAAVAAHCREHLAAYKVPRIVEFRDALPKSAVGKILRREI